MVTHGDSQCTHGDSEIIVHSEMVVINPNGPSALIMHSKIVVRNNIWLQFRDFGICVCLCTPHFSKIVLFFVSPRRGCSMLCLGRLSPKCRCSRATVSIPPGQQFGALLIPAPPQSKSSLPCGRRVVQAGSSYVPLTKPLGPGMRRRDFAFFVFFNPHRIFQKVFIFFQSPRRGCSMLCLGRLLPKCRCSMATASTPPGQQLGAFDFQAPPPKLGAAFPVKGGYFRLVLGAECAEILTTAS